MQVSATGNRLISQISSSHILPRLTIVNLNATKSVEDGLISAAHIMTISIQSSLSLPTSSSSNLHGQIVDMVMPATFCQIHPLR